MHVVKTAAQTKSPVNLRIRTTLKQKAKRLDINMSQSLESALEKEISRKEQKAWLADNRQAIEAYNSRIETHGPALSAFRTF